MFWVIYISKGTTFLVGSEKQSKKGVSPLIATVMLIAFTFVIAVTIITTATRLVKEPATQTEERVKCTGVALSVDKDFVQYDSANRVMQTRIRNLGVNPIAIVEYSVIHSETALPVFWRVTDPVTNTRIDAQQSIIATFNVSNSTGGGTPTRVTFESNCAGVNYQISTETFGGAWPSAALNINRTIPATIIPS